MTTSATTAAVSTTTAASPAASRGDSGREWADDITGFRGLAALTVVVFHAWQFTRGGGQAAYAGTPLGTALAGLDGMISWFFVTSAYLLFLPIAKRSLAGQQPGSARGFLVRRTLRVLPVYWLAILIVWAYRNPVLPGNWVDLLEHLTLTHTGDSQRIFYTIAPAWTLSAEVGFYLLIALVIVMLRRLPLAQWNPRARLAVLLAPAAALIVTSAVWNAVAIASKTPLEQWALWFNPIAWLGNFGLGMLLAVAVVLRRSRPLPTLALLAARITALAGLGFSVTLHGDKPTEFVAFHNLSALCYALLLATSVLAPPTSLWRRALARPVLIWIGTISYGLYIWHEPVLLWLDQHSQLSHDPAAFPALAVMLCVLGTAAGALSYYAIEKPLRNLNHLFNRDGRLHHPHQANLDIHSGAGRFTREDPDSPLPTPASTPAGGSQVVPGLVETEVAVPT